MRTVLRPLLIAAASAAVLAPLVETAAPAGAATAPLRAIAAPVTSPCPTGMSAGTPVTPAGGQQFVVCTARIRSFDGTPLDTDVTVPTAAATGPRPLMVFFHGWGQDKTTWESTTLAGNNTDQYHWNNAWFASQGYAVLNWTARGFGDSCGKTNSYLYSNDSTCSDTQGEESWAHLADRRWEIHDAQYLSGLLVDAGVADPQRIVASGGSYGGGQSWEMALSQDRVVTSASTDPANPTTEAWTSPLGVPMHLAAAAPMYPWTDLADALVQNGTAADGANGGPADGAQNGTHETPIGVEKESYVAGLYADGVKTAQYAAPGADPTADLTTWFAALNAGEPYESNPVAQTAIAQVGGIYRSPFAMPVPTGTHEVPVFVIQGQTDPLFPAFQVVDMINHLRAVDPNYPVWAFLGDVGHAYAFNPQSIWQQAHDEGNAWLASVMAGRTPALPHITVTSTLCGVSSPSAPYPAQTFTANSYGSLATSVVHLQSAAAQTSSDSGGSQPVTPESKAVDPIVSGGGATGTPGCPTFTASQSDSNQASYVWTAPSATLLGAPIVNVDVAVTGENAALAARLWDLDPATGVQTLIDRTVVRILASSPTSTQHLTFELWPQAYAFPAGHQLKLELTQNDQATWRADSEPSSLSFTNLDLALPEVAAPSPSLPEAPIVALLPLVALGVALIAWRRRRSGEHPRGDASP
ncbi:MAG: S15 peptidase family protein [Candidatus Dormibacteria bacterium]